MKSLFRATTAVAALLLATACATSDTSTSTTPVATAAAADTALAAGPAMWVVRDADTTIYLFGTFHLLPEGETWMTPTVRAAFDSSQTLKMELASLEPTPAEAQSMMAMGAAQPAFGSLLGRLTPAETETLAKAAAKLGGPVQMFEGMRPWLANLLMAVALAGELGLNPESGAEKVLTRLANTAGKPIEGFETFEQQIGFFAGLSDEVSFNALRIGLRDWASAADDSRAMLSAWQNGDAVALEGTVNKAIGEVPEFRRVLLEDRNRVWADWIDARMDQPGTVFVAVGAGHLVGNDSVQVFLQQHGHSSVQVTGRR